MVATQQSTSGASGRRSAVGDRRTNAGRLRRKRQHADRCKRVAWEDPPSTGVPQQLVLPIVTPVASCVSRRQRGRQSSRNSQVVSSRRPAHHRQLIGGSSSWIEAQSSLIEKVSAFVESLKRASAVSPLTLTLAGMNAHDRALRQHSTNRNAVSPKHKRKQNSRRGRPSLVLVDRHKNTPHLQGKQFTVLL